MAIFAFNALAHGEAAVAGKKEGGKLTFWSSSRRVQLTALTAGNFADSFMTLGDVGDFPEQYSIF